jgi:integrase
MKGSIRTRVLANGRKAYDALYRTADGQQRSRTFAKKNRAEKYLSETVTQVHRGTYQDLKPATFTAFATTWLKGLGNVKPSTAKSYRSIITRHFLPTFGEHPIHTLGVEAVNRYLAAREAQGRRPKTLSNELRLLHKLLGDAQEVHHVALHPLAGSKALRRPRALKAEDHQEVEVFTPGEINALLDAVDPAYYAFTLTAVSTGLRPGELIGLQWGDIDHANKVLHVRRTYWKGKDYVLKTRASRRTVDVGDQLLSTLSRLARERFGEEPVPLEAPIFFTPDGWRIDPNNFRTRVWMPALAKAGLRYVKPYALRHSFATLLLSQGQSVKYVQEQLGHSSAVMTLNVYAKWLPREKRESPARFEAQLKVARRRRLDAPK